MIDNLKKGEYKIYGAVASFFAVIVIGFIFAVFPIIREIVDNSDKIQEGRIDNEINQKGIERLPEMEKMTAVFSQKINNFEILLKNGKEADFFRHLENLALETGNRIDLKVIENKGSVSKKDSKTKDVSFLGTLPYGNFFLLDLTLFGNYDGLLKFLRKLEKNEKYVNVIGLDISKLEIEEENPNVFTFDKKDKAQIEKREILQSVIKLVVYREEEKGEQKEKK